MRLIDADALIEKFNEKVNMAECLIDARTAERFATFCALSDAVEQMPTVDVAPVVHGRWIEHHDYLKCPECGIMVKRDFTFFDIGDWNFCPNCGKKWIWRKKNPSAL